MSEQPNQDRVVALLKDALDGDLDLRPGAGKADLEQAIEGHVLTMAELVGTYER